MNKINLKLYDIDGCIYHLDFYKNARFKFFLSQDKQLNNLIKNHTIDSHQHFLATQIKEIKTCNYDKLILGLGTNRQDYRIDLLNSENANAISCMPVLPIYQSYFQSKLESVKVELDPFLMADIYGDKETGESYKAILRTIFANSSKEVHADYVFDYTKVSLLYAQLHRVCCVNPDADKIDVDFYDDSESTLNWLHIYFFIYSILVPKKINLAFYMYAGSDVKKYKESIQGQGLVDTQFDWSVRYMAATSYFFKNQDLTEANKECIKTAEQLQDYHQNDKYHDLSREISMTIEMKFNVEEFQRFIKEEIIKLKSNMKLTTTANYMTAKQLCNQNLIPAEFLAESEIEDTVSNKYINNSLYRI